MAKQLTAAAVLKLKPTADRREISDSVAPGLRLVIQASGTKSWAMRFRRPNGKMGKLTLGPLDLSGMEIETAPVIGQPLTLAAARVLAVEISHQRARDRDVIADHRSTKLRRRAAIQVSGANTFAKAATDFIARHASQKTRRWRETARMLGLNYPRTGGDPKTIKIGLCDRWRDKPISEINGDDIYAIVDEARYSGVPGLGRTNKGASDARGRNMADVLGTMFKWLHEHRRVATNPCVGIHRPSAPVARDRVLNVDVSVRNADELRWLWQACDAVGEPFGPMVKLLLLTGCRREEIARLTRSELSDDLSMLRLEGVRTKNGLGHDVPLPLLARAILAGVPQIAGCKFGFSTNGRTPISGFSKYKMRLDAAMLIEAKKEQGENATILPWRLHDLRRTAATGMAGIGIAPHIVEAALNHVSGAKAGVAGTYNRAAYEPEKRTAIGRWSDHVTAIVTGRTAAKVVPLRKLLA